MINNPLTDEIKEVVCKLATYNSFRSMVGSELYKKHQAALNNYCNFNYCVNNNDALAKNFLKVVTWNIERGRHLEHIINFLKNNSAVKDPDVLMITEVDIGMARSNNKNIAECIANELNLNFYYANAYFCLTKGSSGEWLTDGENSHGLHGNAIFSRYKLKDPRTITLPNCIDKFKGHEKRLGSQKALVATIDTEKGDANLVCAHLDAKSSPRQRANQMSIILKQLESLGTLAYPTIIGGDWNTSTYDARSKFSLVMSAARNLTLIGPEKLTKYHYRHPYVKMEPLFRELDKFGFNYKEFNEDGAGTRPYFAKDKNENFKALDWMPKFIAKWMVKLTNKLGGSTSMKIDWIAGKNCRPVSGSAKVLPLQFAGQEKISDHQPVVVKISL